MKDGLDRTGKKNRLKTAKIACTGMCHRMYFLDLQQLDHWLNGWCPSRKIYKISVSATILKKGRPALFVSGWFAIMLTAATVVCNKVYSSSQVLWVSLASHNQLRDTLSVVEMWLY